MKQLADLARECGGIRSGTFDPVKQWTFTEQGLEAFAARMLREAAVICDATADRLRALNEAGKLSGIQGLSWPIEQAADAIREYAASGVDVPCGGGQ